MTNDTVLIEEFRNLTREILTYDGARGILAGLVFELVSYLEKAAEFQIEQKLDITDGETAASGGLAISPTQAAMCAGEELRTALFLRGLHEAITKAIESKLSGPVRVLYAGSGPYATLAVPLMAHFPADQVCFTLIDIHSVSIDSAKSVVRCLGLESSVEDYVITDACNYTIPEDRVPDVILSETMSTALEQEPQVSIMRHLIGQAPDAVMVPESVKVDAFLVDTTQDGSELDRPTTLKPDMIPLGPVFELNTATIRSWAALSIDRLPAATISLPVSPIPNYRPFLFTTITTFGKHTLQTHDCNLTGIREITEAELSSSAKSIQFYYRLGMNPRLVAEVV